MRFKFLGTGTSVGVPQIGCKCETCTSSDPRDRRRRCGAYVTVGDAAFLIDTPPEMRLACVEYGIDKVDAVVLTHAHMDHIAGFDDVRRFNTLNGEWVECDPGEPGANGRTCRCVGKVLPCYLMSETEEAMHRIFPYISTKGGELGLYRPQIEFINDDTFTIGGATIERVRVEHGFPCCGYVISETGTDGRTRRIGYVSDCNAIPDAALDKLRGVEVMVLNCLRQRSHPTHLSLGQSVSYAAAIGAKRTYFIHMCHDLTHRKLLELAPSTHGMAPAYDGMEFEV